MPSSKTHPITIRVSTELLNKLDSRIPDRRRVCREQFVLDAVEAYLAELSRPDLDLAQPGPKITHAISESTEKIKTGRYQP